MFLEDVKAEQNVLCRQRFSIMPIRARAEFERNPTVLGIDSDTLREAAVLTRWFVNRGFEEPIVDECPGTNKVEPSSDATLLKDVVEIVEGPHVGET